MAEFLQILASGLTVGAIYALIGIGFSMIYNTSDITNFPQAFWVVFSLLAVMAALAFFFNRTRLGKAMLATAQNRLAAELMGIEVKNMLRLSFALSALLGALAGVLTAPITLTRYDVGIMLGLKGFCAAILGGLGTATGALAG